MMSGLRDNEPDLAHCAKVLTDNGFRVIRPLEERASYATRERPSVGLVKVAIVDTETTGLDFWSDYMIEAAILIVEFLPETGELFDIVASYSGLEESPIGIPEDATAVSGISDSDVAGMKFDDSRIAEILQGVALVVAHNAEFDRPFLEDRFPAFANLPWACSRKGIRWESEGMGGAKLEYLCDRAGFHYAAHRAITDCRALLELLSMRLPRTGRPALKVLWDGAMESTFVVRQHPCIRSAGALQSPVVGVSVVAACDRPCRTDMEPSDQTPDVRRCIGVCHLYGFLLCQRPTLPITD